MSTDHYRIDMHAHYYGGGLRKVIAARHKRPFLRETEDGSLNMVAMNGAFPLPQITMTTQLALRR